MLITIGLFLFMFIWAMTDYWITGEHVVMNITHSLPNRAFLCKAYDKKLSIIPGQYVRFHPPQRVKDVAHKSYPDLPLTISWIKQVDSVKEDAVFVLGTHPESFDSRHWGPLFISEIDETCTGIAE